MRKKILLDLSILKDIYCGLGQVALNYGKYYQQHYIASEADFQLYLLVPKNMVGAFGNEVKYITSTWFRKHLQIFYPKFDVWHSIHQLSRFRPFFRSTKQILTIHDLNFIHEKKNPLKVDRYLKKIQAKVNRATEIVCISEFAKKEVEEYINVKGKTVEVIYNGVEQLDKRLAIKPSFAGENSKPFFFTIGQVREKKNFHVLLPLMKLFPEKELYIAGHDKSDYAQYIQNMIDSEGIKNVHLVGLVSNNERIWLYKNCEAFFFPSLFEGFGLPIIEAMSFGKPVFSSKETSLQEVGGSHAFFWDSFEADDMKKLIDDSLEKFYASPIHSQENINYVNSFSYEKHMEKYMKIYKSLL